VREFSVAEDAVQQWGSEAATAGPQESPPGETPNSAGPQQSPGGNAQMSLNHCKPLSEIFREQLNSSCGKSTVHPK